MPRNTMDNNLHPKDSNTVIAFCALFLFLFNDNANDNKNMCNPCAISYYPKVSEINPFFA